MTGTDSTPTGRFSSSNGVSADMRKIVLVHGAWHGSWCWASVLVGLEKRGVAAVAVDLPLTDLLADTERVAEVVDDSAVPVVLVGHSYGGAVITGAGARPAVERLVYLCAYAPDAGESVLSLTVEHEEQGELFGALDFGDDGTFVPDPGKVGSLLYGDCDPTDVERAKGLLRPCAASTGSQSPSAVAWREKPTTYVVCGADRGLPPSLQRKMASRIPGADLVDWPDSSHSPFMSRPDDVVDLLAGLAVR